MKALLLKLAGIVIAFGASLFAAKGWGKEKAKRQMLEQNARARRDAKKIDEGVDRMSPDDVDRELRDDWQR